MLPPVRPAMEAAVGHGGQPGGRHRMAPPCPGCPPSAPVYGPFVQLLDAPPIGEIGDVSKEAQGAAARSSARGSLQAHGRDPAGRIMYAKIEAGEQRTRARFTGTGPARPDAPR